MATNVNTAFSEFLKDTVNLDPDDTSSARGSKDWLIGQINLLPSSSTDFPDLVPHFHIHYGSFARRTKARPLDDVDIMIGLHAHGATHSVFNNDYVVLYANSDNSILNGLSNDGSTINSIKVINRFVKHLSKIHQYRKADINRRQEAAVLDLTSYAWTFDIVPCFKSVDDVYGNNYYIIPDGKGNWKKTDPRIDRRRCEEVNQKHDGKVLNVIRVIKYWNKRRIVESIPSYLLENIILNYYNSKFDEASQFVDVEVAPVLEYLSSAIYSSVQDPKGIQGDINTLTFEQKINVSNIASTHAQTAKQARQYENSGDHRNSIIKWQEVFGNNFPSFG